MANTVEKQTNRSIWNQYRQPERSIKSRPHTILNY